MSVHRTSISMPKSLWEIVERRQLELHFGTPSDYIQHLIRQDALGDDIVQTLPEGAHFSIHVPRGMTAKRTGGDPGPEPETPNSAEPSDAAKLLKKAAEKSEDSARHRKP